MCAQNQPSWVAAPFSLTSWWDMQEIALAIFQSVLNALCVIQSKCQTKKPPGDPDMAHLFRQYAKFTEDETDELRLEFQMMAARLVRMGLRTSAGVIDHYVRELSPTKNEAGVVDYRFRALASDVLSRTWEIHRAIQAECSKLLFLSIPPDDAEWYQSPFNDWEKALERWPEMRTNVEECSRCVALDRDCAAVFHALLVAEFGVIKVAELFGVQGDKPGWGSVERLQRITQKAHKDRSDIERKHFDFLEKLVPLMLAIKNSWRHKLDHVDNQLKWLDTDFSPKVAKEIISATQGFMRVLANDLPPQRSPVTAPSP